MKCPKCRRNMTRKEAPGHIFYFECDHCGTNIGKPQQEEQGKKPENESDGLSILGQP